MDQKIDTGSQSYDPSGPNFSLHISLLWESIEYMSFDTLYFLRSCSKTFQSFIDRLIRKGMLKNRIEHALEREIPMFHEVFKGLLITSGAAISGSRILSALVPEITFDDIDVFTPHDHFELFVDTLKSANCQVEKYSDPHVSDMYSMHDHIRDIVGLRTPKDHKIQLIGLIDGVSAKDVIAGFDFNVVKNCYNGSTLSIGFPTAIASKIATHDQDKELMFRSSLSLRCAKYRDKGLTVKVIRKPYFKRWNSQNGYEHILKTIQDKLNETMQKRLSSHESDEIRNANLDRFEGSLGDILDR
jgi:hypothetical protein